MLLLPAQLQRQAPQCGTAACPRQSVYHPTGWTKPSRGMTMVLARTAGAAATGRAAAGAGRTAVAVGASAAAWLAATARVAAAGCHMNRGKLRSQIAMPPTSGPRQRRTRLAMGRATRTRRLGLRALHD